LPELEALGLRITAAVKAAGGSTEVARRASMPLSTLTKYMAGNASPPALSLARIADACGVAIGGLVAGLTDGVEPPPRARDDIAKAIKAAGGRWMVSRRLRCGEPWLRQLEQGDVAAPSTFLRDLEQLAGIGPGTLNSPVNGNPAQPDPEVVHLPVLGVRVAAGAGGLNAEEPIEGIVPFSRLALERLGVAPERVHGIRAHGDSMEPTIGDGTLVLVDTGRKRLGDGIYAVVIDDQARIKRVAPHVDGSVSLISDNPGYPAERVAKHDLDRIRVVGRAFWTERLL
jgi:phage repressor protein C with HTH and peptisase S24 domain